MLWARARRTRCRAHAIVSGLFCGGHACQDGILQRNAVGRRGSDENARRRQRSDENAEKAAGTDVQNIESGKGVFKSSRRRSYCSVKKKNRRRSEGVRRRIIYYFIYLFFCFCFSVKDRLRAIHSIFRTVLKSLVPIPRSLLDRTASLFNTCFFFICMCVNDK